MIKKPFNTIRDINTDTDEGKLLMAAAAVIMTLPGFTDKTPDETIQRVKHIADCIFERDNK